MPYEHLPDPRPPVVRLFLGRLSRWAAWTLCALSILLAIAAFTAAWLDERTRLVLWGMTGVAAVLIAGSYVTAIRWANEHGAWPHRRSSRRQRSRSRVTENGEAKNAG
jgi:hypothetical protein